MQLRIILLLAAVGICLTGSAAEQGIYLTGWARFNGVSHVFISVLPENDRMMISSDKEVGGWRVISLDSTNGTACISREGRKFTIKSPAAEKQVHSGVQYIQFLRSDLNAAVSRDIHVDARNDRTNHREQRADLSNGLEFTEAGSGTAWGGTGAIQVRSEIMAVPKPSGSEQNAQRVASEIESPRGSAESRLEPPVKYDLLPNAPIAPPSPEDILLAKILSSQPPEIGSLIGSSAESDRVPIKRLMRSTDDPLIHLRLLQQLEGYSAPPIANYSRGEDGEWLDPAAAQFGN